MNLPQSKLDALRNDSQGYYAAIARKAKVSKMTVSRVLRGDNSPNKFTVIEVAILLREKRKTKIERKTAKMMNKL